METTNEREFIEDDDQECIAILRFEGDGIEILADNYGYLIYNGDQFSSLDEVFDVLDSPFYLTPSFVHYGYRSEIADALNNYLDNPYKHAECVDGTNKTMWLRYLNMDFNERFVHKGIYFPYSDDPYVTFNTKGECIAQLSSNNKELIIICNKKKQYVVDNMAYSSIKDALISHFDELWEYNSIVFDECYRNDFTDTLNEIISNRKQYVEFFTQINTALYAEEWNKFEDKWRQHRKLFNDWERTISNKWERKLIRKYNNGWFKSITVEQFKLAPLFSDFEPNIHVFLEKLLNYMYKHLMYHNELHPTDEYEILILNNSFSPLLLSYYNLLIPHCKDENGKPFQPKYQFEISDSEYLKIYIKNVSIDTFEYIDENESKITVKGEIFTIENMNIFAELYKKFDFKGDLQDFYKRHEEYMAIETNLGLFSTIVKDPFLSYPLVYLGLNQDYYKLRNTLKAKNEIEASLLLLFKKSVDTYSTCSFISEHTAGSIFDIGNDLNEFHIQLCELLIWRYCE